MEDTELEEGEARFDDNDDNIDPDIALSYIDKRLDNIMGQFQKDFEGLISMESLGPKYGEYGSFLPTQKHPPTPHSHMKALSFYKPWSYDGFRFEVASLNPVTPAGFVKPATAFNNRNVFGDQNALSANDSVSKDVSENKTTTSKMANPSVQRSLKVRIKVGFDKLAKKKDELCSSLGLLSPSSSTGNNPEDSGGAPTESRDAPFDSPSSILRDMTSIFVPGNRLLSPLNEDLLCLTEMKTKTKGSIFVDDSSSVLGEVKQIDVSEVVEEMKYKNRTEPVDGKWGLTNDFKVVFTCEANELAKKIMPFKKRETQRELIEDKLFSPDFTSKESDGSYEQKNVKTFSLDSKGSGRIKGSVGLSICKSEPDAFKHETDHLEVKVPHSVKKLPFERKSKLLDIQSSCKNETDVSTHETDRFEEKVGLKATIREPLEVKVPQSIEKLPFERKSKLMGIQISGNLKENSRSSLFRALNDKKTAQKDIVKVRNSYKDILEDQNIQTKPLDVPTGDGTVKGNHFDINGSSADVAVPQQTEVGLADPSDNWVACDSCEKWRLLPIGIEPDNLPDKWLCSMSTWLPGRNVCDISQDETTKAVQEMNLYLILQNQNSLPVNIVHSEHMNSNVDSEIMPNRLKKSKSRPEASSSSLMENSHSSIEYRPKRKCLSVANEQLLEKNLVNMPADVGRHAANGGDLKPKRLKRKIGSDQYETVTANKIKTENERDMVDESVQMYTECSMKSKLLDKNVEMHEKKRKLKDWQESQPFADRLENSEDRIGGSEKRLKTSNTEVKDKVRTMKIKLSAGRENLVHTSREKDKDTEKVTSSKDLESERFLFAATSSSSKVSGSCRRASLQERKGSPVGSVSSAPIRCFFREELSPAGEITVSRKAHARSGTGIKIPRKEDVGGTQRFGGVVESTRKEASKIRNNLLIKQDSDADTCRMSRKVNAIIPQGSRKGLSSFKDKDDRSSFQRTKVKASDPLTDQEQFPNKIRKVEVDVEIVGDRRHNFINDSSGGKKISRNRTSGTIGIEKPTSLTGHANSEAKLGEMCNSEITSIVNKDLRKVFMGDISNKRDSNEVEPKAEASSSRSLEITSLDGSGQNGSKVMKHPGDADCRNMNDRGVISFLKEYASSQTALTATNRAEKSKDYADRLKISGFSYESTDAYFDSALKFLYAASLLEEGTSDLSKPKGVDPVNVYSTSAKLSQLCAQEYEKRKEMAATALAYKCIEVACMKIVYCKSSVTRQDLQTNMQMSTLGESPSSSASDVDNLNNQAMDKTMLSKSIAHLGNQAVARNQPSVMRLLDLTSDASIAMEASMKSWKAYYAACTILEEVQYKEITVSVKRVVDFSFQNVKEFVGLVQNAREAINRQGFKGNNRQ